MTRKGASPFPSTVARRGLFLLLLLASRLSAAPRFVLESDLAQPPSADLKDYQGIDLRVLNASGEFFCYSSFLFRAPFVQGEDFLSNFTSGLEKLGLSEDKFKVYLDLSPLALKPFTLLPRDA